MSEEKKFQPCISKIIDQINECLQKFERTDSNEDDNNVNTFPITNEETQVLNELTKNIEEILNQHIPALSSQSRNYILNFLQPYKYDDKTKKFTSCLNMNDLVSFQRDFKGLLAAIDAYQAAYNGDLAVVKQFITQYPEYKDKPGMWETTLLYSTARNNHFELLKYLIEEAHCSVNAQNQRDADFALNSCKEDFIPKPSAASTALHAACYNKHLDIVKYLVEHDADYFIENQANETPIMNGERHADIKKYFMSYLIINYSIDPPKSLPDRRIMDDSRRPMRDSFWEYKPFQDTKWYKFSGTEADLLHKSLLPINEQFEKQIYLVVAKGLYSVTMTDFCRSGRHEEDQNKNMAWVRCRGSSILNFDCYSLWQIMIIQHEQTNATADKNSLLKALHFPQMTNKRFQLHLNTWYACDMKTSSLIDEAMNCRRKVIDINVPYVGEQLIFNLQTFEFSNHAQTITGCIRWIPKLVSSTDLANKKIVPVDNYNPPATIQPKPFTTAHQQECSQATTADSSESNNDLVDEDEDEDVDETAIQAAASTSEVTNDDGIDHEKNIENTPGTYSVGELSNPADLSPTDKMLREKTDMSIDAYFAKNSSDESQETVIEEHTNKALKEEKASVINDVLQIEIDELKEQIEQEKMKVKELEKSKDKLSTEKEKKLERTNEVLRDLQRQLASRQRHEQELQDLTKQMKCIDYENVDSILAQQFISSRQKFIIQHLRTKYKTHDYFIGIPNLSITETDEQYSTVTLFGVRAHHDEFKIILQRLQGLTKSTELAKGYYHRRLNAVLRSMNNIMFQQIPYSQDWRSFIKCFQQLIQTKIDEYQRKYDKYITRQAKEMVDNCVNDSSFQSSISIKRLTTKYLNDNPFESEIEILKYEALDEFVKQQVFSERSKFEKKPSDKSLQVLNKFIDGIKQDFRTNPIYRGCKFEQLSKIPKLLQRIMLYYRCFLLQLPLYELSNDLLDRVENNTVITIATSTGSGKSSLLPALLIAEAYEKVLVTQPRRLPCTAICDRVNKTMLSHPKEPKLAGWAVSGDERNVNAPILYLTDGLLKERLLHDENFISDQIKTDRPIVFFIDEVHERSVNIDLCLALFARMLTEKPQLKSKIKIIISSATLDSSVPELFRRIPQIKVNEFTMPSLGTLYRVDTINRPNQNILDLVQELCKKRHRHDQILCFVSSVTEVKQCVSLLNEISRGTLIAHELIQSQSANDQQQFIEQGSIFFSTTVAETSLTFPSLKYVIDTGMINIPIYDSEKKQTTLMEIRAAQSTIKQRLGRLGRTQSGEYYALYDFKVEDKKYPTPQICQSELMNIEFSLRKSIIKNGLNYLKQFLPDPPNTKAINSAMEELKRLRKFYFYSI